MRKHSLMAIGIALTIGSCHEQATVLRPISIADGNVELQIPQAWKVHRQLPIIGPDCALCSGEESNAFFGETFPAGNHVFISVTVDPAQRLRSPLHRHSLSQAYKSISEKNPGGITLLDTVYNQRGNYSEITYLDSDQTHYLKSIEFADRYRRIVFSFKVVNRDELQHQVQAVQSTIRVNPDFLNTAKL